MGQPLSMALRSRVLAAIDEGMSALRWRLSLAMDLQQRQTQYGHLRHHSRPETQIGRVNSMSGPR